MAAEVLRTRERIADLDARLEELVATKPEAEVVRSMPGMGPLFTAEFLSEVGDPSRFSSADSLAAAAGLVPATRQSGGASFQRRARRGNRTLKNLFYRSALGCTAQPSAAPLSPRCTAQPRLHRSHRAKQSHYLRRRAEGKVHHQAVIALARRKINVLWAMLRDGELYEEKIPQAA